MILPAIAVGTLIALVAVIVAYLRQGQSQPHHRRYVAAVITATISGTIAVSGPAVLGTAHPIGLQLVATVVMAGAVIVVLAITTTTWRGIAVDQYIRANASTLLVFTICLYVAPRDITLTQDLAIACGLITVYIGLLLHQMATARNDVAPGNARGLQIYVIALIAGAVSCTFTHFIASTALQVAHQLCCVAGGVILAVYFVRRRHRAQFAPAPVPPRPKPSFWNYWLCLVTTVVALSALAVEPAMQTPAFFILAGLGVSAVIVRQMFTLVEYEALHRDVEAREETFRTLVHNASDVIVLCDPITYEARYVSPAAATVLRMPAERCHGQHVHHLLGLSEYATCAALDSLSEDDGSLRLDGRLGSRFVESFANRHREHIVITIRDVTEREELKAQLRLLAYYDPLTGLFNRHRFDDEFTKRLAERPDTTVLMFIDLDRFKAVNDSAGHDAGDAVLQLVSSRLTSVVAPRTLVARFGGDEFVMVLDTDHADVTTTAQSTVGALAAPCVTDYGTFRIGCSVGIALPEHGNAHDDMLRHADIAMYSAKNSGENVVTYDTRLGDHRLANPRLDLRGA